MQTKFIRLSAPQTARLSVISVLILLAGISCNEKQSKVDELGRANAPAQTNNTPMPSRAPADEGSTPSTGKIHEGTIQETIDVKDYTYIRFTDQQGLEHWAAVLKGKFTVGKKIAITESIVMKDFNSPTLNRTFDSIIFGNAPSGEPTENRSAPGSDLPTGHPPIDSDTTTASPRLPEGHPPVK